MKHQREESLHEIEQIELRGALAAHGLEAVSRATHCGVMTVLRAGAGLGLRAGTKVVMRAYWGELARLREVQP